MALASPVLKPGPKTTARPSRNREVYSCVRHAVSAFPVLPLRPLDQDVAQVELLPRLDSKVPAHLVAFVRNVVRGSVANPINRAGDKVGQGDAAVSIGRGEIPVMARIDVFHVAGVGSPLAPVLFHPVIQRGPGRDDELEATVETEPGDGPAIGSDEPCFGPAVGLKLDSQIVAGLITGKLDRGSALVLGVEKDHRDESAQGRGRAARNGRRGRKGKGRPATSSEHPPLRAR